MGAYVAKDEAYLIKRSIPEPNTGCWLWELGLTPDGYALMIAPFNRAHRLAAKLALGDPPPDKEVDHICKQRSCVNPAHMRYLTHVENIAASLVGKVPQTHCKRGHPLSGDNVQVSINPTNKRPQRSCKICDRYTKRLKREAIKKERELDGR